jgi:DNA recombination protein RmuC
VAEHDPGLLDEALRAKVVCCSPLTLFAVLAVIRQAVDAFSLERRTTEVLDELGAFSREWDRFVAQMDRVETHLDRARRAYDDLVGVRRRTLERPLERLAEVRRGPAQDPDADGGVVRRLAPTGTDTADSGTAPP